VDLFFAQFESQQGIPGLSKWLKELLEVELEEKAWGVFESLHTDVALKGCLTYSREELKEIAGKLKMLGGDVGAKMELLQRVRQECLDDRCGYREFCPNVIRLVWQSLCTTLLSRRVKEEVDIDDGTYTKVDKVRMASEFKRLGVFSPVVIDEDVENMRTFLKSWIRDLKRIFQFYAAAEMGGDASTMDSIEYKKFVRDCQFQKDRKVLPSVRIDLIFQACCIDQTKTGKARIESATDDVNANK